MINSYTMTNKSVIYPLLFIIFNNILNTIELNNNIESIELLSGRSNVIDTKTFPYMAAILKKSKFISSGALIDESWVVTGAASLYTMRESSRMIRVRLGSISYKNGGYLTPIKLIEIHPYFDTSKPLYDIALVKFPEPVKLIPNISPIRLEKRPRNVVTTHFTVAAWTNFMDRNQIKGYIELELKNRQFLKVSHLHPMDPDQCLDELDILVPDHNNTKVVMCLDPSVGHNPCQRETGAPVVLNDMLWGIISSWKSEECDVFDEPTFVTLVPSIEISSWIHSTIGAKNWKNTNIETDYNDT